MAIRVTNLPMFEDNTGNRPVNHDVATGDPWYRCFYGLRYYHTDTEAEMESLISVGDGDLCFTHDTKRLHFWDGTVWRQLRY